MDARGLGRKLVEVWGAGLGEGGVQRIVVGHFSGKYGGDSRQVQRRFMEVLEGTEGWKKEWGRRIGVVNNQATGKGDSVIWGGGEGG